MSNLYLKYYQGITDGVGLIKTAQEEKQNEYYGY